MDDKFSALIRGWKVRLLKRMYWPVSIAVMIAVVILLALRPERSRAKADKETPQTVVVPAAKVQREDLYKELKIPAEFRPYVEVELHAKVSGYLRQINVDFGDRVKAGQLLATLEVPELQDQLHNAIATQQKAEADYTNAHLAFTRLTSVNKDHPNLVAQQDLDAAEAKDGMASAAIAAAKADVEKFQTLVKYTQIAAPFDGVVTHRYADPGSLIQAGTASDTQSMPLVRLSDNYHLRMDFYVDVDNVKDIHVGDPVEVRVGSLGGRTFTGKISRCTYRVEDTTRKMTAEIEVSNPNLELVPGMYATVFLKVDQHPQVLTVPHDAIGSEKDTTVYVINDKHEIESRPVMLGLEMPDKYEVTSGLKEGDLVLLGNRSLVQPGERVEPKLIPQLAGE